MEFIEKLKSLSPAERRAVLDSEAASVSTEDYLRPLQEDEMQTLQNELAQACVKKGFIETELKAIKDDFKGRLKPIDGVIRTSIMCLTSRMKNEQGKVFLVPDYDNKVMYSVTENGDMLNARPMRPEERQYRLQAESKAS